MSSRAAIRKMRHLIASVLSASLALALPLSAIGQTAAPRHARAQTAHAIPAPAPLALIGTDTESVLPVWNTPDGRSLTVAAGSGTSANTIPATNAGSQLIDAHSTAASTGLQFNVSPKLYTRAGVGQRNWLSNTAQCQPAPQSNLKDAVCLDAPLADAQSGEIGTGYSGDAVKLDLSVGQSRTNGHAPLTGAIRGDAAALPRVLPSDAGVTGATPLLFPDSTATSLNARGQWRVLPDTALDLGASRSRVHFLPGAGLPPTDDLNQTTLSLGIEHGPISGAIVGRMLQPALPGAAMDSTQRWSGIDLGVSVRLPWQGELSFGAQNVWSSGKQPLLNPQDISPEQTRVPYVQYHQDL